MKQHSNNFKNNIKKMGREFKSIITLIDDDTDLEEELYSVSVSYDGNILKSVMKELKIESSMFIEKGTELKYKLGLLVGSSYEYLDYGKYYVYDYELQEDTGNYVITCYDRLLYSMVEYKGINETFPMTIRDYINTICSKIDITFANNSDTFANYDRVLTSDLYAELGYTYRDIFDELAQVTASTICINDDNELEIRYLTNSSDTINEEYLKDTNVAFGEKYRTSKFNSFE